MLINEAGWVAFGFIIFCIIAWRYGAKPFVDVLEARANEVREKLSEAENLRNEAKKVLDNFKVLQKEAENEAESRFKLQLRITLKNLFHVRKNKLNKKLKLQKNKHF